jgi:Uma2 family endonuclease
MATTTNSPSTAPDRILSRRCISIEEYLGSTRWRPDVEYLGGLLIEKPATKSLHGVLQSLLGAWFVSHVEEWGVIAGVGVRTQVAPDHVRLPDVLVNPVGHWPEVIVEPPLIVIEILSPTDSFIFMSERVRDYLGMGVPNVWLLDPESRTATVCRKDAWTEVRRFEVDKSPIFVDVDALLAQFDKYGKA